MDAFEEIFGTLNRLNPEAEDFVQANEIVSFYDDLRKMTEISDATQGAVYFTRLRIGRMIELLPASRIKDAFKVRAAMMHITKELLEEQAEIMLSNHVWRIYRDAERLLGEDTLYLGFVLHGLKEGMSVKNTQLVRKLVASANDISEVFENAVVRYFFKPYDNPAYPKKLPQEMIDYFRKLRIERYRYADAIVRDYEKGRILAQD